MQTRGGVGNRVGEGLWIINKNGEGSERPEGGEADNRAIGEGHENLDSKRGAGTGGRNNKKRGTDSAPIDGARARQSINWVTDQSGVG